MKQLFIIGSGGFSKQVIEIVEEINKFDKQYDLQGIIDDDLTLLGNKVLGYEIVGDTNFLSQLAKQREVCSIIAIGNGETREKVCRKLQNIQWVNLIHPKATVSNYISLGEGIIICAGVIINPDCRIGNHCNINIGSTLGHDVVLDEFVTIMPGSNISGNVTVKEQSTIGTGASVIQGKIINENTTIGAGAVVVRDIEGNGTYAGVPAKKIKNISNSYTDIF